MTILRFVGTVLLAIGGIATVVCVVSLIDPVGTKVDNGAPFFMALPWSDAVIGLLVSLAMASIGSWLRYSSRPTSSRPSRWWTFVTCS